MTTGTRTDWKQIAAMEDEQLARWITEHGRHDDEGTQRDWMRDFIGGTLEQDEDNRRKMMHGFLSSMLTMEDGNAKQYATNFQWVLDHGKGDVAFSSIQALHTAARHLPVDDTLRLGQIWPRVFGKDIAGTV